MKTIKNLLFLIIVIYFSGCASLSQYKMIKQSQVETAKSKATLTDEVVIVEKPFIAFEEVIERSPNVTSVTRVTDFKGNKEPSYFTISPTTSEIIFQAIEEVNNSSVINLWKTSTTNVSGITRLTAGRYFDMEPSFTRDGKSIFFASNRSSNTPKLFRVNTGNAGGITRITNSDTEDRFPSIDINTGQIYYMSRPNSSYDWQIWYTDKDGSFPTQLKEGTWPQLSPDGKRILYCSLDQKINKWKIWRMSIDGTEQTQLTSDVESDDLYPSWSSNGKFIIYSSDIGKDSNGKRNFDIWLMSDNGGHKTQLTTNGSTDLMPQFSPDNRFIYFLSNRGFNWDIWRMRVGRVN